MATNPPGQPKGITVKFPETLDLKDLITIVSVAVSLTVAWGVFSTRIAIVEREIVSLQQQDQSYTVSMERLQAQVRRLEAHQQDDELILDQVFTLIKQPYPQRRARD